MIKEGILPMTGEWIVRLAEDERRRDGVRFRVTEAAARKAQLVAAHGQRLLDELRATVTRDIDAFRAQFPEDEARDIRFDTDRPDGGFVVRKPESPTATLTVTPRLLAASLSCLYHFTPTDGMPPREDRLEFVFTSDGDDNRLQIKHYGTGQLFTNADALSEYLLVPVFTGRPR
jgi:hypothetical protein